MTIHQTDPDHSLRQLSETSAKERRFTADRVGRAVTQPNNTAPDQEAAPAYGNEHILVCLSTAPSNAKVIRTAARIADVFHGSFSALFVETPEAWRLDKEYREALSNNMRLAEQLGAQITTVFGEDIPEQIAEYAKISHVNKIVIGRSIGRTRQLGRADFVGRLTALAPDLDIYIIPDTQSSPYIRNVKFSAIPRLSWRDIVISAGLLALCTLIALWFSSLGFNESNIIMVYILGVLLNAIFTSNWVYSTAASILSVIIFDFVFIDPRLSLNAYAAGYPITFAVMLFSAFITSSLTERVKKQAHESTQKAYRTEVLLETSRKLQQAKDENEILRETARQMVKLLDRTVIFYSGQQNTLSQPLVFLKESSTQDAEAYIGTDERKVAEWVYKNKKHAGATTGTLSDAKCLYLAVRGDSTVLAVAAIVMDREAPLGAFEKSLAIAMLEECALALEKERLDETRKQISIRMQQEQLRANVLRTISHDLRTPLTSISGNAGILMRNAGILNQEQKKNIYSDIYDDSMWLISLVENLLSITKIDNGEIRLNLQPELFEDVIAEALRHVNRNSTEHIIQTVFEDDLLMAKMDSQLMTQVIVNIVNNAIKYTQPGSHITITAKRDGKYVRVEIADNGPGIPDEEKSKLFDMFYTVGNTRGDDRRGLGLGLYLCRSILTAHGGSIYVRDNVPRGAVFGFTLEAAEVNVYE